jgi:hypothetical protein
LVKLLQIRVCIEDFQRILTVLPGAYQVELVHNEKTRQLEFYISIPDDENQNSGRHAANLDRTIHERKNNFRKKLVRLTEIHHAKFLAGREITSYDLGAQEVWHHEFELHRISVENIRMKELPVKPQVTVMSIKDFLKTGDCKDTGIKKIFSD